MSPICVTFTGEEIVGVIKIPGPLYQDGSSHKAYFTPEVLKVGRYHGDIVFSASHYELHKAILDLWPNLEPLQWDREMELRKLKSQYPTLEEDRRCLQASLQTALES